MRDIASSNPHLTKTQGPKITEEHSAFLAIAAANGQVLKFLLNSRPVSQPFLAEKLHSLEILENVVPNNVCDSA